MNMNRDPECEDPLLEVLLRDETWQRASAALKEDALGRLRARRRARRLIHWTAGMAGLLLVLGCGLYWFGYGPVPAAPPAKAAGALAKSESTRFLSDAELLASFPQGTCFLAEINGRKELIFLDRSDEQNYLDRQ